jgi:hypothetical protein
MHCNHMMDHKSTFLAPLSLVTCLTAKLENCRILVEEVSRRDVYFVGVIFLVAAIGGIGQEVKKVSRKNGFLHFYVRLVTTFGPVSNRMSKMGRRHQIEELFA